MALLTITIFQFPVSDQ